jgi:hypothetical protein
MSLTTDTTSDDLYFHQIDISEYHLWAICRKQVHSIVASAPVLSIARQAVSSH